MHKEILSKNQLDLLPLLKDLSSEFGLVGGTAIALHLSHRRSIDFDLFTSDDIDYCEKVAFMPNFEVSESEIKKMLVETSIKIKR